MLQKKPIVTISRTYGSGGSVIGRRLATAMGVEYFDRELIMIASQETGLHVNIVEQLDERLQKRALWHLPGMKDIETRDSLFLHQEEAILRAAREPCVIVGRCADWVLRKRENVLKLFLYANKDARRKRVIEEYGVDPKEADDVIRKVDKERAAYYNYHTEYQWGDIDQYDLCLNTSDIDDETAVKLILAYIDVVAKNGRNGG